MSEFYENRGGVGGTMSIYREPAEPDEFEDEDPKDRADRFYENARAALCLAIQREADRFGQRDDVFTAGPVTELARAYSILTSGPWADDEDEDE